MYVEPSLQIYLAQISKTSLLTAEREADLCRQVIRHNDQQARSLMVMANMRLVVKIAKWYTERGLSLGDLIAEGNIGLIHAVERFNPDLNTRFSTYAAWWIKRAILDALANRFIHIPRYMRKNMVDWKRAYRELEESLGREPQMQEMALHMSIPLKTVRLIGKAIRASTAVECSVSDNSEVQMHEMVSDDSTVSGPASVIDRECLEVARGVLNRLGLREATIVKLYYGLEMGEPMTLQEIGERFGLTRERVRQIKDAALEKLFDALTQGEREEAVEYERMSA